MAYFSAPIDNVELQQIAGRIARPPRRLRFDPREPGARKVQPVNEGVNKTDRIFGCSRNR